MNRSGRASRRPCYMSCHKVTWLSGSPASPRLGEDMSKHSEPSEGPAARSTNWPRERRKILPPGRRAASSLGGSSELRYFNHRCAAERIDNETEHRAWASQTHRLSLSHPSEISESKKDGQHTGDSQALHCDCDTRTIRLCRWSLHLSLV